MLLIEIAAYILVITLIIFYSTRVLWLFFLLFCYRFWESILSYSVLSKYIKFSHSADYFIILVIISLVTYFTVMALTLRLQFLRYILLLAVMIYVLRQPQYGLEDVFFFRDYLKEHGMWNLSHWINEIKLIFQDPNKIITVFTNVFQSAYDFLGRLVHYLQK